MVINHTMKYYLIKLNLNREIKKAPVAQLDRALGYGPGGSGFKS